MPKKYQPSPAMLDLRKRMTAMRDEYLSAAQRYFADASRSLFDDNPSLESFRWQQYTPYRNDGEECEFSAHISSPDINGIEEYDDGYDDALQTRVVECLSAFEPEQLKDMFGDHATITVSRGDDGPTVHVGECDHE